jgi:hypothetical protein
MSAGTVTVKAEHGAELTVSVSLEDCSDRVIACLGLGDSFRVTALLTSTDAQRFADALASAARLAAAQLDAAGGRHA